MQPLSPATQRCHGCVCSLQARASSMRAKFTFIRVQKDRKEEEEEQEQAQAQAQAQEEQLAAAGSSSSRRQQQQQEAGASGAGATAAPGWAALLQTLTSHREPPRRRHGASTRAVPAAPPVPTRRFEHSFGTSRSFT